MCVCKKCEKICEHCLRTPSFAIQLTEYLFFFVCYKFVTYLSNSAAVCREWYTETWNQSISSCLQTATSRSVTLDSLPPTSLQWRRYYTRPASLACDPLVSRGHCCRWKYHSVRRVVIVCLILAVLMVTEINKLIHVGFRRNLIWNVLAQWTDYQKSSDSSGF